jgi:DNA repair protein SbcC/Rad50
MLPRKLILRNFLAYRTCEPLVFDGIHLACLTGANGAGKSSLLDAITWVLWGKARASRDEDLIHHAEGDMSVELYFEQDGTLYHVIRRKSRSGRKSDLNWWVVDSDGAQNPMPGDSITAREREISSLLRMSYDTFVHSAFLQQGKADAFIALKPTERKRVLAEILDLDRFRGYEEAARDQALALKQQLVELDARISVIDEELSGEPALHARRAEAESVLADAEVAHTAATEAYEAVRGTRERLRTTEDRRADRARQARNQSSDLADVRRQIETSEARLVQYEGILAAESEIEGGYQQLQRARAESDALNDALTQLRQLQLEQSEVQARLREQEAELERQVAAAQAQQTSLQAVVARANPDALADVEAKLAVLEALEAEKSALENELNEAEKQRAALMGENRTLRAQMDSLKAKIDRLMALPDAPCPTCGQPLTADHRIEVAENWAQEGKAQGDAFRANDSALIQFDAFLAAKRPRLDEIAGQLKDMKKLQKQQAELNAAVKEARKAERELVKVDSTLSALLTTLETQNFGAELRAQLGDLAAREAALGYDDAQASSAREALKTFSAYDQRHRELANVRDNLPMVHAALDGLRLRAERAEQALAALNEELAVLDAELSALRALVEEEQRLFAALNEASRARQRAQEDVRDIGQQIRALESQRARRDELAGRRDEARVLRLHYETLREAFGKNGIPADIIEAAIPELEDEANRLLGLMTEGRMSLRLRTQKVAATSGNVSETLDLDVSDGQDTRAYEMFSGGEAFRVNFALRVALSKLLSRRAGAQLRTLFIDEGFGTQDEEGRGRLVEAINRVQHDFDLILVITHFDDLKDSFPVQIQVEKFAEGSRASVR